MKAFLSAIHRPLRIKIGYLALLLLTSNLFCLLTVPARAADLDHFEDPCTEALIWHVSPAKGETIHGTTSTYKGGDIWSKASFNLMPIIPSVLLGKQDNGTSLTPVKDSQGKDIPSCTPAYWNTLIFEFFLFKATMILNWLAGALFIILVVYAGILYISGFAVEANVKKAKSLVITAITGFLIVYAARYIIYGAGLLFSPDSNTANVFTDPNGALPLNPVPTTPPPVAPAP